jgi:hypothetical protein
MKRIAHLRIAGDCCVAGFRLRQCLLWGSKPESLMNARTSASTGCRHGRESDPLAQAVKWEMLVRNPADAVDPPKTSRASMQTYNLAQTAELIEAVRGKRIFVSTIMALLCGLRRGEIAALRWRNVDLATAQGRALPLRKRTHSWPRLCGRKGKPSTLVVTKSSSDRRLPTLRSSWACAIPDSATVRARPLLCSLYRTPAFVCSADCTTAIWVRQVGEQRARAHSVVRRCCCTELRRPPSIWKVFARAQRRFWGPLFRFDFGKTPPAPTFKKPPRPRACCLILR